MFGIVLAGPTGVGKTDLSLKLAEKFDAEIISADSMQIYKYLDIGTAKINKEEMNGIKHYMLDIIEPIEDFSVGLYQKMADEILQELYKKRKNVIITGGTGLYIESITEGLAELPKENIEIRKQLEEKTKDELYDILLKNDIESAQTIHKNNKKRVIRAIEIYLITGKKMSDLKKNNIKNNKYKFLKFAVERERENLYDRINQRVDIMFDKGLLKEAEWIYNKYKNQIIKIQAIGYKELFEYFEGKVTLEEAKDMIKKYSRNYAKRQFTWFKNKKDYIWYNLDKESPENIIENIIKKIKVIE